MPQKILDLGTMGWREGAGSSTSLELHEDLLIKISAPAWVPPPRGSDRMRAPDHDPEKLQQGRWAAVVLEGDKEAASQALKPLIDHRRELGQLHKDDGLVVLRPSESGETESWRRRFERAAGDDAPYYVMLVGGPDRFPFEMQFDLDLERFTGRLDVSDEPGGPFGWEACRRFAEKLVAFEKRQIDLDAKALFYSVTSDDNTRVSHEYLVEPVAGGVPSGVTSLYKDEATPDELSRALAAARAPRLVFAVSHGVECPTDPLRWGALTGAAYRGRATDPVISAAAVSGAERFGYGSVLFAFACFSAGFPERSGYAVLTGEEDSAQTFGGPARVAPLARQLVGHARGPVAFVGHVDRVTAVAFQKAFGLAGTEPYEHFEGWTRRGGATLGQSLGTLREQARRVGAQIAGALESAARDKGPRQIQEAIRKWIAFRDYQNFVLIGDPALTFP